MPEHLMDKILNKWVFPCWIKYTLDIIHKKEFCMDIWGCQAFLPERRLNSKDMNESRAGSFIYQNSTYKKKD